MTFNRVMYEYYAIVCFLQVWKMVKKKESVGVPLVPRKCQRGNVGTVDCILSPAAAAQQRVINGTI